MVVYAIAYGHKTGVFEKWNEVEENIKDFPQPVYKKFSNEEEAKKFLTLRAPRTVQEKVPREDEFKIFYAVARGYDVGIFGNYELVEKSIKEYPQPLMKKFDNIEDAKVFYNRYQKGIGGVEPRTPDITKEDKPQAYYAVARGRETGVFLTYAECKQHTVDFPGAKFKKFFNEEDAKMFAEGKTLKQIEETKAVKRKSLTEDKDEPSSKKGK